MKKLLSTYIRLLIESIAPVRSVEKIGKHEINVSTFSLPGGSIVIWENSPYGGGRHSIYSFVVDESQRGLGIGSKLIDNVMQAYSGEGLSGQVSSLASLKVLHNKGFRPPGAPSDVTFEELIDEFNDNGGSLNMSLG